MSKRNLLNLILFVFVALLITLVIFEPGKETAITPNTLTKLKTDDIQHIRITRPNEPAIELYKNEDGWQMSQPYQQSANVFRIKSILKLLNATSFSQNSLVNLNLIKFGLKKPLATITFNNDVSIEFGHNKSLNHHRYVKIGSTLHLIPDTFYYQLATNSESFINHKLLPEKSKIKKLILPTMELEQIEDRWNVTAKNDFSADAINQLIDEWQLSQAYNITIDKKSNKLNADIKIYFKNSPPLFFNISEGQNNFNLTNVETGIRYILSADRKDKLLKILPTINNE